MTKSDLDYEIQRDKCVNNCEKSNFAYAFNASNYGNVTISYWANKSKYFLEFEMVN